MGNDALDELSYKRNIEFKFEHPLFKIEGCVFRRTSDGETMALFVPMGDILTAVPIHHIRREFEIGDDSNDAKLMKYAEMALQYVRRVFPGDSIPADVISGRCPWMVEEEYIKRARNHVRTQILLWKAAQDTEADLTEEPDEAEEERLIKAACQEFAEKLGLEKDGARQVTEMVDKLVQELAYIEALRDRLKPVRDIRAGLNTLFAACREEKAMRESITRCTSLMDGPIKEIFAKFDSFDANTSEILNTLRQFDAQIHYIRVTRDELRQAHMKWEEIIEHWADFSGKRDDKTEALVRQTYHFAAQHFVQMVEW